MAGRLYSIASGWGKEFENVADLLLKTDTLLDRQKLPQAFQEKRSFQKKSREEKSREETAERLNGRNRNGFRKKKFWNRGADTAPTISVLNPE